MDQPSLSSAKPWEEDKVISTPAWLSLHLLYLPRTKQPQQNWPGTKRTMKELEKQMRNVQIFLQPDCFQDKVCPVNCKLPTGQALTSQGVIALAITEMLNAAKCRDRKTQTSKVSVKTLKKKKGIKRVMFTLGKLIQNCKCFLPFLLEPSNKFCLFFFLHDARLYFRILF